MPTSNQKTEKYLNKFYASMYSEEEAVKEFSYLTHKNRSRGVTTEKNIRNCYTNHTLGTFLKKYDPIAFECLKRDLNFK